MADKKVVIAGATGLVGNAALRHFGRAGGCDVVALSRRKPRDLHGARQVSIDLTDPAQCAQAATSLQNTTHLVYAALHEAPNLIDGWRDPDQIRTNDAMLRNLMAALEPVAPTLRHVALLLGTKAYGVHVRPLAVPAREGRSEMYEQPNFYWAHRNIRNGSRRGTSCVASTIWFRRSWKRSSACRFRPDTEGAAFDRFDREDQPGGLHRDDGHRSDVPQMVHPRAREPAAALARGGERHFHRPARLDGVAVFVDLDIAPAHYRAMGNVVLQLDAMGKADRQRAG